jgi:hypothetical protein
MARNEIEAMLHIYMLVSTSFFYVVRLCLETGYPH